MRTCILFIRAYVRELSARKNRGKCRKTYNILPIESFGWSVSGHRSVEARRRRCGFSDTLTRWVLNWLTFWVLDACVVDDVPHNTDESEAGVMLVWSLLRRVYTNAVKSNYKWSSARNLSIDFFDRNDFEFLYNFFVTRSKCAGPKCPFCLFLLRLYWINKLNRIYFN